MANISFPHSVAKRFEGSRVHVFFRFLVESQSFYDFNPEEDSNFSEMSFIEVPPLSELFRT
jgi:hypothetical protein